MRERPALARKGDLMDSCDVALAVEMFRTDNEAKAATWEQKHRRLEVELEKAKLVNIRFNQFYDCLFRLPLYPFPLFSLSLSVSFHQT